MTAETPTRPSTLSELMLGHVGLVGAGSGLHAHYVRGMPIVDTKTVPLIKYI